MSTVNEMLLLPGFQGSSIVAGGQGGGRQVENLSVMEVPDIEDYVKPGDFLLTTLFPFHKEQERLRDFIPRMVRAGLSGMGIKLNRYIDELPTYFLAQADEYGLPLVVLPADSNLSDLINIYLKDTLQRKSLELEYRNSIHSQLLELMVKGEEYGALAGSLSALVRRDVVLLDAAFEPLAVHRAGADGLLDTAPLKERALVQSALMYLGVDWDGRHGVLYPVHYGAERAGYILVSAGEDFTLSQLDRVAVEQFSIAFRILVQKQRALAELEHRYVTEFICDLLYGKIDSLRTAVSRAEAFGWDLAFPQTVCLIDVDASRHAPDRVTLTERIRRSLSGRFTGSVPWRYFCANTGRYLVLLLDGPTAQVYERVFETVAALFEEMGITRYHISVSRPAAEFSQLPRAFRDAQRTMEVAGLVGSKKLLHFKETGAYRLLQSIENKEELAEFCSDTLGPILEYDQKHHTDLLKTLEAILQNDGNLKETAERLFVHYNTIRYRSKLITSLLGHPLTPSGAFQDLGLALKIYHTLHFSA